jgi:hypothetical protein
MNAVVMQLRPLTTPGERRRALLVRHWAYNMTVVHDQGSLWPGFAYTPEEQEALRVIARRVPVTEYFAWVALIVPLMLLMIVVVGAACFGLISLSYGDRTISESLFVVWLALTMVTTLTLCVPLAMWPASMLVGRWFKVPSAELPDPDVTARYLHKLWFQMSRMAVLLTAVVLALCLFAPERFWVISRVMVPILGPAVSLLTAGYFLRRRR